MRTLKIQESSVLNDRVQSLSWEKLFKQLEHVIPHQSFRGAHRIDGTSVLNIFIKLGKK